MKACSQILAGLVLLILSIICPHGGLAGLHPATYPQPERGYHVKVDYSGQSRSVDWVKSGNLHETEGETAETRRDISPAYQPGKITEGRTGIRTFKHPLGN